MYITDPNVVVIICRLGFRASWAYASRLILHCMGSFLLGKTGRPTTKASGSEIMRSGVGTLARQIRLVVTKVVEP